MEKNDLNFFTTMIIEEECSKPKWKDFSKLGFLSVLFLIILQSCGYSKKTDEDSIRRIEVCFSKDKLSTLYASEFISDIEYVCLETSPECFIGDNQKICLSDNYILIFSMGDSRCLLFSRQGEFLRHIGNKGQGPREYVLEPSRLYIDEESNMIYLSSIFELLAYRITGEFVKKLNLNELTKKAGISRNLWNVTYWKDDLFCSNVDLSTGKEPYSFVIFTLDGDIVKLFPNHLIFDSEVTFGGINFSADIYNFNGQLSFMRGGSDTLFRLNEQMEFVPELIFDLCGREIPTHRRGKRDSPSTYTYSSILMETENYLLLHCNFGDKKFSDLSTFYCLYDKNRNKPTIVKPEYVRDRIIIGYDGKERKVKAYFSGFINDLDGGPNMLFSFYSDRGQIISSIYPYFLLTKDYSEGKTVIHPEWHQRYQTLLTNLDEEDNTVLMISHFKIKSD